MQDPLSKITLNSMRTQLTRVLLGYCTLFTFVILLLSLSRIPELGFLPVMYFHTALLLIFTIVYFQRCRFNYKLVAGLLSLAFFTGGLASVHNFGFAAAGTSLLYAGIVTSAMLIGTRSAVFSLIGAIIVLCAYAIAVTYFSHQFNMDGGPFLYAPSSWVMFIISFVFVNSVILFLTAKVFTFLTKMTENQLEQRTHYDFLTSLPNRRHFMALGEKRMQESLHKHAAFAVLNVDIKDFKSINEKYSQQAGDYVLISIAQRLKDIARKHDIVARIGADEFAFLIKYRDAEDCNKTAVELATNIKKSIAQVLDYDTHKISNDCYIGIAVTSKQSVNAIDLSDQARLATRHAKREHRNAPVLYEEEVFTKHKEALYLRDELEKAIARNQFSMAFQPIVHTSDGKIKGFEALARWIHPEKGFIPPDVFIKIAEENGLMVALGKALYNSALKTWAKACKTSKNARNMSLSLNVSVHQLYAENFASDLNEMLKEHSLSNQQIILEITETSFIKDVKEAITILQLLKDDGFTIALDDFGTGFSSLAYLEQLPIDILKIDRSFINKIEGESSNVTLINSILYIAHEMNLALVAEGIETKEQQAFLSKAQCNYLQGYLFSKPVSADELFDLLLSHRQYQQPPSTEALNAKTQSFVKENK